MQFDGSNSLSVASEPPGRPELGGMDEAEIRCALERIVASLLFHQAEQPIRLLRFIVECTLAGSAAPKEYRLAVEAFGRDPEFDPRNDTMRSGETVDLWLAQLSESTHQLKGSIYELPFGRGKTSLANLKPTVRCSMGRT
jgi:hypothetical protein